MIPTVLAVSTSLLLCAACACAEACSAAPAAALVAGAEAGAARIPADRLATVRASRQLVTAASEEGLIARGVRKLIADDAASYRFAATGSLVTRFSYAPTRTDRTVQTLVKEARSHPASYDVATIELPPMAVPHGRRVEAPVKFYTATMEVRMDHFALQGSMTENIGGFQVIGGNGGGNGGVVVPANYPIELPNVGGLHIQTGVSVPAGSSPDTDYRLVPSPRDPRQAIRDLAAGALAVGKTAQKTRLVLATVPLATTGNTQRNWLNQAIREHCARTATPLIDLAAISATGPDGSTASDTEGPRLHQAWDGKEGSLQLAQRAGSAWYWMQARLAGWDGAAATSAD